jgi:hypothetical protein
MYLLLFNWAFKTLFASIYKIGKPGGGPTQFRGDPRCGGGEKKRPREARGRRQVQVVEIKNRWPKKKLRAGLPTSGSLYIGMLQRFSKAKPLQNTYSFGLVPDILTFCYFANAKTYVILRDF